MAIKQVRAIQIMEETTQGKVVVVSLSEIMGNWIALVEVEGERKIISVSEGNFQLAEMLIKETSLTVEGLQIDVALLNPNNAAAIRRFIKWSGPTACGTKGISIGFSDWLGMSGEFVAPLFSKKQIKPVLAEYSAADSMLLQRTFLDAVDAATWGVWATGYKEGYGANAEGLKTEEDIVKALLYGYSMIGLDCSEKINLQIEKMSDAEVDARYNDFPQEFRDAMQASYLEAEFQVGAQVLKFDSQQLKRIVLEYGEAIMHVQFIYNSYLKNTPWDIDFELNISKSGKLLTPEEHYLIGNELQRNGIKLTTICLNVLEDLEDLQKDLQMHGDIAEIFGYRLSFLNADLALEELNAVAKTLKGRVHFKLSNVLWLAALQTVAVKSPQLLQKMAIFTKLKVATVEELTPFQNLGREYALSYGCLLAPEKGNFAAEVKEVLAANLADYNVRIVDLVGKYLKNL